MKLIIKLNEEISQEDRDKLKEAINNNGGYCPCVLIHNPDTKCICKEFRKKNTEGPCHCGLYKKVKLND